MKKLYRSETNTMIAGVFGGIGEYIEIDATILRLSYAFFTLFTGCFPGVLFYILACIIIPKQTSKSTPHKEEKKKDTQQNETSSNHLAINEEKSEDGTKAQG